MRMDPSRFRLAAAGITFTNNGVLRETGSGQLQLVNNLNVVGGTLATAGSQIHSLSSTLTNVTNSANAGLVLSDLSQTTLVGTMTNNGNILFQGLGNNTYLFLSGNVTLAGSGTITLDNTGLDHIYALNFGDTLTIGANQTIQGSGDLGAGQTNIVNNGTITANQSTPLLIALGGGSGSTNNATGILQATSGGILQLSGGTFTNNGTLREVGTGLVQLTGGINVMGGTLAAAGSQIHSVLSTLTNVTNNAGLVLSDLSQTTLVGTMTNNGNILFQGLGNNTYLFLSGNVTLAGNGTITLDNTGLDHIYALNFGDTLTIGANQTIQGGGNLGDSQTSIVNNGTINANGSIALQIGGDGITFTNNGVLRETGSGQLQLVNNLNVVGGTLATAGSQIHSLSSTLTNVTNSANAGLVLSDLSQTTLVGTMTNNGNILFQGLGNQHLPVSLWQCDSRRQRDDHSGQHRTGSHLRAKLWRHANHWRQPNDPGQRGSGREPDQYRQQRHDHG